MLGFDVPTFVFQIINFLILLAIMARFFYRPVLDIMQKRQAEIDARLEDAERRTQAAENERQRLVRQSETAGREAASLIEEARNDAARERQRLLAKAKAEAAALIDEARRNAAAEEQAALGRLGDRVSKSAIAIAATLIRDASGEAVHAALIQRVLEDDLGLSIEEQEEARRDFGTSASRIVVESAYALNGSQEQNIRGHAARLLDRAPETLIVEARETPELIAGVRIVAGSLVIDMNIKHLLEELGRQEGAS